MKKIVLITLMLIVSTFKVDACVELTIDKHIGGDPICLLSSGSRLEICIDDKTIRGGGRCNFYIQSVRVNGDLQIYEFGLDKSTPWFFAPKYGELMINVKTQKLAFEINNITGTYSYFNESQKKQKQNLIKIDEKNEDIKIFNEIKQAISKQEFFKANELYKSLNQNNNVLQEEILSKLNPLKEKIDVLYSKYMIDFRNKKNEFYLNKNDFIKNNSDNIKISNIVIDGKSEFLKKIEYTSDKKLKADLKKTLNSYPYIYEKINGQHLIASVGLLSVNEELYSSNFINNVHLEINYDTIIKNYTSNLNFCLNDTLKVKGAVVNRHNYDVKIFTFPYTKQLLDLLYPIINEIGLRDVHKYFPLQTLNIGNIINIPINSLKKSSSPGIGIKNKQFDELDNKFETLKYDINEFTSEDLELVATNKFYNPLLLFSIKKLYPTADSLIFIIGDHSEFLGNLAYHIPSSRNASTDEKEVFGSIVPLIKGKIEMKNDNLITNLEDGNYKESGPINIMPNSYISLSNVNLENLNLDSSFIYDLSVRESVKYRYDDYSRNSYNKISEYLYFSNVLTNQFPLSYEQYFIDKGFKFYLFNDSTVIRLNGVQNSSNLYSPNTSRPSSFVVARENLYFDFYKDMKFPKFIQDKEIIIRDYWAEDRNKMFKNYSKYYLNMIEYLKYRNVGEIKKSEKSLLEADENFEKFKFLYFNSEFYY